MNWFCGIKTNLILHPFHSWKKLAGSKSGRLLATTSRMYAIYKEGGIYMDSDVYVLKKFDRFLHHGFFTSEEYTFYGLLQSATFGGVKGHPLAKSCMDWYSYQHYILPDGQFFHENKPEMWAPRIFANQAMEYGYRNKNGLQRLKDNIVIYPSYIFPNKIKAVDDRTYAVHLIHGSWTYSRGWKGVKEKVYKKLSHNHFLRKVLGYKPLKHKTIDDLAIFESPSEELVVNEDYQSTDFAKRDDAKGE